MDGELTKLWNKAAAGSAGHVDYFQFTFTILGAIIFGLVLQRLYEVYFQDNEPQDSSLARGLVILTPALTAIFWMVQTSLALALCLLGSLSNIRFRTSLKRVEDIAFIIVMLVIALSLAVRAPAIAVILLALLFLYAFIKNRAGNILAGGSPAVITFNTRKLLHSDQILTALKKSDIAGEFVSARTFDGITSYVLSSHKAGRAVHDKIQQCLIQLDAEAHINIFYPNGRLGV